MRVCPDDWRGIEAGRTVSKKQNDATLTGMDGPLLHGILGAVPIVEGDVGATSFRRWSVLSLPSGRSTDNGAAADAEAVGLERPEGPELAIVVSENEARGELVRT